MAGLANTPSISEIGNLCVVREKGMEEWRQGGIEEGKHGRKRGKKAGEDKDEMR